MTWSESVDQALCFGWIDGRVNRIDDESYSHRFTPRKPGSNWSKVNIDKVAKLEEQGLMRPAIHWVVSAKREETRERRLATLIEDSANGRTVKPLTRP